MVDIDLVCRKISKISKYKSELDSRGSVDAIGQDVVKERFMEFTLQQIIQLIMDIGNHVLSDEKWEEPKSSREIFEILKDHQVVSEGLASELKKMVGFRNLLVHEYMELDKDLEKKIFEESLGTVDEFIEEFSEFLSNLESQSP